MRAVETRLEFKIDRAMKTIESGILALSPQVTSKQVQIRGCDQSSEETLDRQFERIETKLKSISDVVDVVSVKNNDGEDRKRLKEKLKEAMKTENVKGSAHILEPEPEPWMEYIFGICKPDGRIGKPGSR